MQDYIDVPGLFLNYHPEIYEEFEIELLDPVGNLYEARLSLDGRNPRYGGCFDQIRATIDLKENIYICFSRIGHMMYHIRICDKNQNEVHYTSKTDLEMASSVDASKPF